MKPPATHIKNPRMILLAFVLLAVASAAWAEPPKPTDGEAERTHVHVTFKGIPKDYGEAVATLAETVWRLYHEDFSLDMPDRLNVSIDCRRSNRVAIWTDGVDRIEMTLRRRSQLHKPSKSKVFNIYGLCYEIAELALSRTLGNAPWLDESAARGWCHYCAGEALDRLYSIHGLGLWPNRHHYEEQGIRDLEERMKKRRVDPVLRTAGHWLELRKILERRSVGVILKTWRESTINPSRPAPALRTVLVAQREGHQRSKLRRWFEDFSKSSIVKMDGRGRRKGARKKIRLSKKPTQLKHDDDGSEGKDALKQLGHLVAFETPPDQWYLTRILLYGERFGGMAHKGEKVTVTLCDKNLKPIQSWDLPYGLFRGARPRWHRIPVPPTPVPAEFAICVQCYCTDKQGVRVHRDDSAGGHSSVGLPGGPSRQMKAGNWMIRAEVDTSKRANPLLWRP